MNNIQATKQRILSLFRNKNISGSCKDVLMCLTGYIGKGGYAFPSVRTLAERTGWSIRTIIRAIQQGQSCGILSKTQRRSFKGGRFVRASNLYRFIVIKGESLPERGMRFLRGRVVRLFQGDNLTSLGKSRVYNKAQRHESSLTREQMIAYCFSLAAKSGQSIA